MEAGSPPEVLPAREQLDIEGRELHVAGGETRGSILLVAVELRLQIKRDDVADLRPALERQSAVDAALELETLVVDEREIPVDVPATHLSPVDRREREEPGRRRRSAIPDLHPERDQLGSELLDEPIEHRFEILTVVVDARGIGADLFDGARHQPRRFRAAQRLGVENGAVEESGRRESLQIVVGGVPNDREPAPVLQRDVGTVGRRARTTGEETNDEGHADGRGASDHRAGKRSRRSHEDQW